VSAADKCHCGAALETQNVGAEGHGPQYRAHCPRCSERARNGEGDGFIVVTSGYGRTRELAMADYHESMKEH
jgi:hypothetical protein